MRFIAMFLVIISIGLTGFCLIKSPVLLISEKELIVEIQNQGNPTVIDKYISGGGYKSRYKLTLDFGDGTGRLLEVTQNTYDTYSIGDTYYNKPNKQ